MMMRKLPDARAVMQNWLRLPEEQQNIKATVLELQGLVSKQAEQM